MQSTESRYIYYMLPTFKNTLDRIKIANLKVGEYRAFQIIYDILTSRDNENIKILKYYLTRINSNNIKITDTHFLNFLLSIIEEESIEI